MIALNISERGLRLEHVEPLKLRVKTRISIPFPRSNQNAELRGEVVWSRLSKKSSREGKYLYRSGVRLEDTPENHAAIRGLLEAYRPSAETGAADQRQAREPSPQVRPLKIYKKPVDPDRVLLIHQVSERLKQNPEEMRVRAGRARSALSIRIDSVVHTDEALAIWEYLQHIVSLDEIREVLSGQR